MAEFLSIAKDFTIDLPQQKITEIFRRSALSNEMSLDQFKASITILGDELSKAKLRENRERLKELNQVVKSL